LSRGLLSVEENDVSSWSSADLAGVLSALCRECADLAGVLACSIVVTEAPHGFFSAAGSTDWVCALDDFQLSEEAGPTWECCQTGKATQGDGLHHRGLTGTGLVDVAPLYGVVGCGAVPLLSRTEVLGALTLYWGPSTRETNLLTPGVAIAAMATKAIEFQRRQDAKPYAGARSLQTSSRPGGDGDPGTTYKEREALSEARDARATARDARALARDSRAAERDARAAARDEKARTREETNRRTDPDMLALQVEARRDRFARFARINGDLAATAEASVAFGLAELETDDSLADLITRADSIMYANRYQRSRDGGNSANTSGRIPSKKE